MKTLALEGNDLMIQKDNLVIIENEKEVAQSLSALLNIRKGEFMLDEHVGMEQENMLGKNVNFEEVRDDIIEALSQDERVELVDNVAIKVENRKANVTFNAKLVSGKEVKEGVELDVR
jgi:hypothetical protein